MQNAVHTGCNNPALEQQPECRLGQAIGRSSLSPIEHAGTYMFASLVIVQA